MSLNDNNIVRIMVMLKHPGALSLLWFFQVYVILGLTILTEYTKTDKGHFTYFSTHWTSRVLRYFFTNEQ